MSCDRCAEMSRGMHSLRRLATERSRRDAIEDTFSSGLATGLRIAANDIGRRLGDPLTLEADHRCICPRPGCIVCELLALSYDSAALLVRADDACACEHARQCDACAMADIVRRELRA